MSFYDEVLRELIVALGAALVVGNGIALFRRRADAQARARAAGRRSTKAKGSSRARGGRTATGELVQAPVARSIAFLLLGVVMFVAGSRPSSPPEPPRPGAHAVRAGSKRVRRSGAPLPLVR